MKIIIVGAGLAGLTCAKVLRERGAEVAVFEASDGVGGRVRTDEQDGFLLDRGFQVYFTSYPVAGRHLDYEALDFGPLALRRIPYGQFAQPPGIHRRLPEHITQTQGLVLAGEYTEDSSINGSMLSGEKAARAVIA
jgi:monoamine oxidase